MSVALCTTFQELAVETWRVLEWAQSSGLKWSEETNTETLLRALHLRHPREVAVRAVPKAQEVVNGADWEWWIGGPGCWVGMRVQAKRIKFPAENFGSLQSYKSSKATVRQIDALISAANNDKLNPVYCLYSYAPKWAAARSMQAGGVVPGLELNGCMIGHAGSIRATRVAALRKLARVLNPWHTLVCPGAAQSPMPLGQVAYAAIKASFDRVGVLDTKPRSEHLLFPPQSQLPRYLQGVASGKYQGISDGGLTEASGAGERGIRGFVIIRGDKGVEEQCG